MTSLKEVKSQQELSPEISGLLTMFPDGKVEDLGVWVDSLWEKALRHARKNPSQGLLPGDLSLLSQLPPPSLSGDRTKRPKGLTVKKACGKPVEWWLSPAVRNGAPLPVNRAEQWMMECILRKSSSSLDKDALIPGLASLSSVVGVEEAVKAAGSPVLDALWTLTKFRHGGSVKCNKSSQIRPFAESLDGVRAALAADSERLGVAFEDFALSMMVAGMDRICARPVVGWAPDFWRALLVVDGYCDFLGGGEDRLARPQFPERQADFGTAFIHYGSSPSVRLIRNCFTDVARSEGAFLDARLTEDVLRTAAKAFGTFALSEPYLAPRAVRLSQSILGRANATQGDVKHSLACDLAVCAALLKIAGPSPYGADLDMAERMVALAEAAGNQSDVQAFRDAMSASKGDYMLSKAVAGPRLGKRTF